MLCSEVDPSEDSLRSILEISCENGTGKLEDAQGFITACSSISVDGAREGHGCQATTIAARDVPSGGLQSGRQLGARGAIYCF